MGWRRFFLALARRVLCPPPPPASRADLVEVDRVATVSDDRLEFAIWTRGGKHHTFRASSRDQFVAWTGGLQQYVVLAQAYYAL